MSGVEYEQVARFAQQGGTILFGLMFLVALTYGLWPRHKDAFNRMAALPLENDEDEHVHS